MNLRTTLHNQCCIWTLMAMGLNGCYAGDETLTNSSNTLEKKPKVDPNSLSSSDSATPPAAVANATYAISITTNSGAEPCTGAIKLKINGDFTLAFPAAEIKCLSLTIDIGKILSGQTSAIGGAVSPGALVSDGKILALKNIGTTTFAPPRPFLIGPIVQNPADFLNFSRTTAVTMTVPDAKGGAPLITEGSFLAKVIDVDHCYTNAAIAKKGGFSHVMHWQMQASGFKGASAVSGLTFKNWEWYWNTRPIMIPKIIISLDSIADFVSSGDLASTAPLLGELKVTLTVQDYDTPADPCPGT